MGLTLQLLARETVEAARGQSFEVRGLSLPDMTRLVRHHGGALQLLIDRFAEGNLAAGLEDITALGSALMNAAPEAAAEAIALAAGDGFPEPVEIEIARQLPASVQLEALEKIGRLSFTAEGGPGKFVEMVIRVARGLRGTISPLLQT